MNATDVKKILDKIAKAREELTAIEAKVTASCTHVNADGSTATEEEVANYYGVNDHMVYKRTITTHCMVCGCFVCKSELSGADLYCDKRVE